MAKRDQPKIAEQLWTFPPPKGPKGRHVSGRYRYWGIWNFSPNKAAAKSLLLHLSGKDAVEKLVVASQGFDIPPFDGMADFKVWEQAEPPKGTHYNFPARGDVIVSVAGHPAPARIGVQMYAQGIMCKMIAQCTQQGRSIDDASASSKATCESDRGRNRRHRLRRHRIANGCGALRRHAGGGRMALASKCQWEFSSVIPVSVLAIKP